ncbi:PIN domain-containing protein [Burkholderia cenocepacia]|uniref:PIN domain-containing protein n=1 Tax=Burkholderia cenocepacia TaxID=95486 RepID=UPI003395993C
MTRLTDRHKTIPYFKRVLVSSDTWGRSTELAQLRIEVVPCAIERVDWNDMMRRSVFREPPFERGQTEKGFRDAILCETFLQLASEITGGDTIMLVSNDRMVKKYIDSCAIPDNKARVVDGLDALNDEIQLRVANVDEITQAFIELRARLLFCNFEKADDPHTLWVKERIHWQVWHKYGDRLKFAPAGVTYVLLGQELSDARLTKKEGQRVYFETTLWIRSAYRMWIPAPNVRRDTPGTTLAALGNSPALEGLPKLSDQSPPSTLSGLLGLHTQAGEWKEIEKATKDEISIRWSATFTKHRTLTRASIDAIELVDLPSGIGAFNRGVSGGS